MCTQDLDVQVCELDTRETLANRTRKRVSAPSHDSLESSPGMSCAMRISLMNLLPAWTRHDITTSSPQKGLASCGNEFRLPSDNIIDFNRHASHIHLTHHLLELSNMRRRRTGESSRVLAQSYRLARYRAT
jgi:hypothetical protein